MNRTQHRLRSRAEATESGCWRWTGWLDRQGYGKVKINRQWTMAHRATYQAFVGPIPDGMELDHLCRFTSCVNPDHLEPVTRLENMRRRRVLTTHCIHGHPFDESNTYLQRIGNYTRRTCRTCGRAAVARYLARKRATAAGPQGGVV